MRGSSASEQENETSLPGRRLQSDGAIVDFEFDAQRIEGGLEQTFNRGVLDLECQRLVEIDAGCFEIVAIEYERQLSPGRLLQVLHHGIGGNILELPRVSF